MDPKGQETAWGISGAAGRHESGGLVPILGPPQVSATPEGPVFHLMTTYLTNALWRAGMGYMLNEVVHLTAIPTINYNGQTALHRNSQTTYKDP